METKASYIFVGLFILGLLGAGVAYALWLARPQVDTAYFYMVRFDEDVTGLRTGGDVRFHGVRVGEVMAIDIDGETERVEVKIQVDEGTPIRGNTVARLEAQGITGATFIQLRRAKDAAAGSDQTMPGTTTAPHPEIPSELSTLQAVFKELPRVLAEIKVAAQQMAALLNQENLDAISQSLENVSRITKDLSDQTGAISTVFAKVERTLVTADEALIAITGVSRKIDGAIGDITKGVNAFEKLTVNIDGFITENRRPVSDFTATGLYEMTQFLIDAREMVQSLTRITGKLESDPARFLFGDQLQGYQAQ